MYKTIKIKNFRCFENLTLDKLRRVNLIVGKNNVGKSALLEAIFLHCGAYNPDLIFKISYFRGIENIKIEFGRWTETPWDSLFLNFDPNKDIEIIGENSVIGKRELKIHALKEPKEFEKIPKLPSYEVGSQSLTVREGQRSPYVAGLGHTESAKVLEFTLKTQSKSGSKSSSSYLIIDPISGKRIVPFPPPPPFPAFFQSSTIKPHLEAVDQFSQLEKKGKQDILIKALKFIEPRLVKLSILIQGGLPIIHGDIGLSQLVPLPLMGEGMVKVSKLLLNIASAPGGVVLIDEVENGIHYSVLPSIWQVIGEAAKEFNVQIFATTHSMECIMAAHEAFLKSPEYDFGLYRLEKENGLIKAISFDKETLSTAIDSYLEVR